MPSRKGNAIEFRLSRFSEAYRCRLVEGLKDLVKFCLKHGHQDLHSLVKHPSQADKIFADYVINRHSNKEFRHLSLTKHALLCVQHVYPILRGKLQTAWGNMKVWEEERTSALRPPIPVPIFLCAVGLARAHGKVDRTSHGRNDWIVLSVLLELGFFCLLRPVELLRMRHSDISLPGQFTLCEQHAAIRITSPKNRRQFGDSQFVLLRNRNALAWLKQIHVTGSDELVWKQSRHLFGKMLKQLMCELGVQSCKFTPASLRPGGATMYYGAGVNVSTLKFMGRWSVERSLEHYIQLAMAAQIMNHLPPKAVKRLKKIAGPCMSLIWSSEPVCGIGDPSLLNGTNCRELLNWCQDYTRLDGQCRA